MKRVLPYAAAAASGALMALALPLAVPLVSLRELDPAGRLEPLAFVALVPAILAVRAARTVRAALLRGLVAGLAYFYAAIWWVSHAMTAFGGLSAALAFVALSLLVLYMAVHWAAAFGISFALRARLGWPLHAHLPVVWVALELSRNYLLTGFPWANLGYTQARTPHVAQLAALVGVYGVAALVVLVNGVLAEALVARRERRPVPRRALAVAGALLVAVLVHGELRLRAVRARMAAAPHVTVGIVQPNVDQSVKNEARNRAEYILSRLVPLTVEADRAGADLVAWPEASYPLYVRPETRSFATRGSGLPGLSRAHLLMGAITLETVTTPGGERVRRVGNVDFLLTPSLDVLGVYRKHHLVPFGEYVPLQRYLGFLGQVVPSLAPTAPGDELRVLEFTVAGDAAASSSAPSVQTSPPAGGGEGEVALSATASSTPSPRPSPPAGAGGEGDDVLPADAAGRGDGGLQADAGGKGDEASHAPVRLAPMICFDAIFPEINVAFARKEPEPEILVNPTNDAWYGYSSGPYQFLAIVRMRAIEAGKAVVRPAYAGVSAVILPTGELAPGALEVGPVDPELAPHPPEPARLLLAEVPRLRGLTPYTRFGDLFAYACAGLTAVALAAAARRRAR
jgi:apolipoprotein N-acyltransferase